MERTARGKRESLEPSGGAITADTVGNGAGLGGLSGKGDGSVRLERVRFKVSLEGDFTEIVHWTC